MFIVFEGCDGTGKTTQLNLLADLLRKRGVEVISTREPGGTEAGELLREIFFRGDLFNKTELMLVMAARAQHVREVIQPAMYRGAWVLCDRFCDSTYVYQGGKDVRDTVIEHLNSIVCGYTRPDVVFFLNGSYEVCLDRITKRGNSDKFESNGKEFFEQSQEIYRERSLLNSSSFLINADQKVEDVHTDIVISLTLS